MDFPKKKDRKKPTEEQREDGYKRRFRNMARKELMRLAKEDPQIMAKLIEKEFGIQMPDYDPVKEAEAKLQKLVVDQAIERVKHDDDLKEHLVARYLHNNAEQFGIQVEPPEVVMARQKAQFQQTLEIMRMLGINPNPSFLDTLKDPRVITEIIRGITRFIETRNQPADQQASPAGVPVSVEVNGKLVEMSGEEYKALKQLKEKQRLAQAAGAENSDQNPPSRPAADGEDAANGKAQRDENGKQ